MSLTLDHIVIAVADLDSAFSDFTALGFTTIRGGEHASGITHNVLVVLEDGAYLELIAWKRPDAGNRWSDIFHGAGEGFVDYALLPGDIAAVVSDAQARGLDIETPTPGGRNRPDGERLEWKTARSPRPDVPFLCGDVTPRALRVQEGAVRHHPNGITGVASLTVVVRDLDLSISRNQALFGATVPTEIRDEVLAGTPARTAVLKLGPGTAVMLASPTSPDGALAASLAARGEGPFSVTFRSDRTIGELDPARTHGARLSAVGPHSPSR